METALWGLLSLFIVAMTGLAYRKPTEYTRLMLCILLLFMVCMVGGGIYAGGYTNGAIDAQHYLLDHKDGYFSGGPFPFNGIKAMLLGWGVMIYAVVLGFLPSILGIAEPRPDEDSKDTP